MLEILRYFFIIQFGVRIVVQVKSNPVAKDSIHANNNSSDKILQSKQCLNIELEKITRDILRVQSEGYREREYRKLPTKRDLGETVKNTRTYTTNNKNITAEVKKVETHSTRGPSKESGTIVKTPEIGSTGGTPKNNGKVVKKPEIKSQGGHR